MSQKSHVSKYNLRNIRALLLEGFSDEDLRRFCYDTPNLRSVYDRMAQDTGKARIVDLLVKEAERKLQFETVLEWAAVNNPGRYEKHKPYYEPPITSTNVGQATILFADNDVEFLNTRTEYLDKHGYKVIVATNPLEAKRVIEQEEVSLAVLDMRLLNNSDKHDFSGINVARESNASIPKIILTLKEFSTVEAVKKALGPALDGLSPAVDFIAKEEGPEVLVTAIRRWLAADRPPY